MDFLSISRCDLSSNSTGVALPDFSANDTILSQFHAKKSNGDYNFCEYTLPGETNPTTCKDFIYDRTTFSETIVSQVTRS